MAPRIRNGWMDERIHVLHSNYLENVTIQWFTCSKRPIGRGFLEAKLGCVNLAPFGFCVGVALERTSSIIYLSIYLAGKTKEEEKKKKAFHVPSVSSSTIMDLGFK